MKKSMILVLVLLVAFIIFMPEVSAARLKYDSLCAEGGVRQAAKILGYVITLCKWIVPLLITVLGMVDFGKAAIANDEKALSKAGQTLAMRIIAGLIIFFIPTIVMAILNLLAITNGIENEQHDNFGACTKCLFDPMNSCD